MGVKISWGLTTGIYGEGERLSNQGDFICGKLSHKMCLNLSEEVGKKRETQYRR